MMKPLSKRNSARGYTLVEAIITVAIFAVVSVLIVGAITFLYRANSNAIEQAFALASARKGVDKMVQDIREAAYSDEGRFPIQAFSGNEFIFYSDTDRDLYVERIRYFLDGTDLKKGVLDPTGVPPTYNPANEVVTIIADNVRNIEQSTPVFRYFNENGTEIIGALSILDVTFVQTKVIVNVNPLRLPEEFTLYSSVTIRNLKTNL